MFIDTHCHLNDRKAYPDPRAEIVRAKGAGVTTMMVVGVDLAGSRYAIEIAEQNDSVYAIVGHHPNCAQQYTSEMIEEYEARLAHPKVVSLGEIGLDFYRDHASVQEQMDCLNAQLDLAEAKGAPVVFHCREAYDALLSVLEDRKYTGDMLFHCFAGTPNDAERALKLGQCMFGVNGPITYAKADELRATIRQLPRDRIVLETDCPYLSPVPHRGKPNHPAYIPLIAEGLARVWDTDTEEVARVTTANAHRFFRLMG
ncbi:MAG: TatD family hydrolase [Fimbriimonadaceae bacterium]